jgi:catechol 2,3-dioxygenase-like lactoylglutathione lyase family enzyme
MLKSLSRRARAALVSLAATAAVATPALAADPSAKLITGINHVGVNVPDAEAAAALFADLFGMHVLSTMTPGAIPAPWKQAFNWHPDSQIDKIVMLGGPGNAMVELFQYSGPQISRQQPHEDDAAATHIAFTSQDLDKTLAVVRARGLKVLADPVQNPDGTRWVYFLTPWGSQIEIVQNPKAH